MYVNKAVLSTNRKSLFYYDSNEDKIVKYNCVLKNDVDSTDIGYLYSSLYGMKLSSISVNGGSLQEGKTTCDLIHEIEKIISSTTISFQGLISVFNIETTPNEVIEAPVRGLLNLFDIESKEEYTDSFSESEEKNDRKNILLANTVALKNISLDTLMSKKKASNGKPYVKAS